VPPDTFDCSGVRCERRLRVVTGMRVSGKQAGDPRPDWLSPNPHDSWPEVSAASVRWRYPAVPYIISLLEHAGAGPDFPPQIMKRLLLFPFLVVILSVTAVLLLLASNFYTFHRLTAEEPIAELRFTRVGEQEYEAVLRYGDFCTPETYRLYGDQWRLDAEFLKWRAWANLLGFDAMYRIERLGSRYLDIQGENTSRQVSYALRPAVPVDLTAVIAAYHGIFTPVDTLYGSSVYDGMDEAAVYRVFRGQSGLFVRKAGILEEGDAASGLTIEINAACATRPGIAERFGRFVDAVFTSPERQ
jgi:hypothetical protein